MGTYYRFVNYTRREYVTLSRLRDGGDKENAVHHCADALTWLMFPCRSLDDTDRTCRGRWNRDARQTTDYPIEGPIYVMTGADVIAIVADHTFDEPEYCGGFVDISEHLRQELFEEDPEKWVTNRPPKKLQ